MLCQSNRHHTGWIRLGFSMRAGDAHHIRHSIRFKFIPWKGWHFQNIHLTDTNLCIDFFLPETSVNILYQYAICINLPHVFRPNRAPRVAWASASSARRAPRCDEYDTWRERKRTCFKQIQWYDLEVTGFHIIHSLLKLLRCFCQLGLIEFSNSALGGGLAQLRRNGEMATASSAKINKEIRVWTLILRPILL